MFKSIFLALSLLLGLTPLLNAQNRESVKQLDEWTFYGNGTKLLEGHGQYLLKENPEESKGIGLISPKSY